MVQEIKASNTRYIRFKGYEFGVFLRNGQYSIAVPDRNNGSGKIPGGIIFGGIPEVFNKYPSKFLDTLEQEQYLLQNILETHEVKF